MATNNKLNTFLYALKTGELKTWFYKFRTGHIFLLHEEADIIVETRLNDKVSKWMNESQIQNLVKLRVEAMYKRKFPDAKKWTLPNN